MSRSISTREVLSSIEKWAVSKPEIRYKLPAIATELPAELCKDWPGPDCHAALTHLGVELPRGEWGDAGAMFAVRLFDLLGAAECANELASRSRPGKEYFKASANVLIEDSMASIDEMVASSDLQAKVLRFLGESSLSPSEAMVVFQAVKDLS